MKWGSISLTIRLAAIEVSWASAMLSVSSAIERAAGWKLPSEMISSRSTSTIGLSPVEFSSVSTVPRTISTTSRTAPWTWLADRKLIGSCTLDDGFDHHRLDPSSTIRICWALVI